MRRSNIVGAKKSLLDETVLLSTQNQRFYICSEVIDSITDANSGCLRRGLG